MVKVFAHPWDTAGYRSASRWACEYDPRKNDRGLQAVLALGLLALFIWVLFLPRIGFAATNDPLEPKVAIEGPLDFDNCVRLAIQQSPYLIRSSVEIDIRRLDETDSRFEMIPPLTFRSYYYVNRPGNLGNSQPYSLNFSTDPYNPFSSYFTLQAQKMATQMAIFGHLKIIAEGLERMGKMFMDLAQINRMTVFQADLISLSRENLTYAENRMSIGTGTSLEVRVASQELELAKTEKDHLEISRKRTMSSLKNFLGLTPNQEMTLDLRDARRQVLGSFDPAATTLEQAKVRSYELKVLELKKEMQGYNILLAKAKIFPTILFTTQTPDPLSVTSANGLYVGFGLDVPVWDGFKRIRNVSRQKAVLKQFGTDKDVKEIDFTDRWNLLQENLQTATGALKMAQSQMELARLKERQSEIRYQSGAEPLPTWINARKANLQAQKEVVTKAAEYDEKVLTLRQFSGDLGYSYVDQNSWKK